MATKLAELRPIKKKVKTGKPGPPYGSRNAQKHGGRAAFSRESLDGRSRLARAWDQVKSELVFAIGGDPSPQEQILIDRATFKTLKCALIEAAMLNDLGKPDTGQYLAWSNSLRLDLQALGLKRAPKTIDLATRLMEGQG